MFKYKRHAVALLLAVALAGCGGVASPNSSNVKAPEAPASSTPAPPPAEPQGGVLKEPATAPVQPAAQPQGPGPQAPAPATPPAQSANPGTQALTFSTLQKGAYSGVSERKVVLVTDEATWQTNWQQISSRQVPAPGAPALDFAGQSVVVATLGEKSSGGYSVEVTGVQLVDGKLKVTVKETRPGPGQIVTMALTQPYHVVRIPKVPAGTTVEVVWQ